MRTLRHSLVLLPGLFFVLIAAAQDTLPPVRSFSMGFTPWPYDLTDEAQQQTYDLLSQHSDLILHHMDTGIPWQEALDGTPYPANVLTSIQQRIAQRRAHQKVYLSITPNALADRNRIADIWGAEEHLPLPPAWAQRSFDDPLVMRAFLNHARFMIAQFQPDYFAYGIEVSCALRGLDDPAFQSLLAFAAQVYPVLKAEYPGLPIFLTICSISLELDDLAVLEEANRQLIAYSDYVGLSLYPYLLTPGLGLRGTAAPQRLPADLLTRWANLAPHKPFAITETGYIAEPLRIERFGIDITADEAAQAAYVARLLAELHTLEAEFVIWFVLRDYDALLRQLEALAIPTESFLIWRDTGLFDGAGQPRPALRLWDAWLALPHIPAR